MPAVKHKETNGRFHPHKVQKEAKSCCQQNTYSGCFSEDWLERAMKECLTGTPMLFFGIATRIYLSNCQDM